ncbi:MAG TPA: glycerophosphodiester phosphodiesterase [Myxococcota bacterium]|nr:glycerophosphodiester phosphodiesterase [Myxococcota bacterium]
MSRINSLLIVALLLLAQPGGAMEIVGHRGAAYLAPENTLQSVKLAYELGADAAEIDVQLTRDGRIVVIHDPTTGRTAGQDLDVAKSTAAELRRLDVGVFKGARYKGAKIPFLEEILADVPDGKKLLVEVKCGVEIVPLLIKTLERSGKIDRVIVISFHFEVVVEVKRIRPKLPVLWLVTSDKDKKSGSYRPYDPAIITRARGANLSGLGLRHDGLAKDFAQSATKAGLLLFAWTVDDPSEARRLRTLGIDALISNRPGRIREQLGGGRAQAFPSDK